MWWTTIFPWFLNVQAFWISPRFFFCWEVLALHGGGSNANIMKYQVPLSQSKPWFWKTCCFFWGGGLEKNPVVIEHLGGKRFQLVASFARKHVWFKFVEIRCRLCLCVVLWVMRWLDGCCKKCWRVVDLPFSCDAPILPGLDKSLVMCFFWKGIQTCLDSANICNKFWCKSLWCEDV